MGKTGRLLGIILAAVLLVASRPSVTRAYSSGKEEPDPFRAYTLRSRPQSNKLHEPMDPGRAVVIAQTSSSARNPAPPPSSVAGPEPKHHTVQSGDSLWGLSMRFGISTSAILTANGLKEGSILSPGQDLLIPYSNEVGSARFGGTGPVVSGRGLHFVASVSQQKCWLFRDGTEIDSWVCSTGRPESPSALGNYTVQSKERLAYSLAAEAWMPYWLGIYDAGTFENGIHGLPFSAETGEQYWTDLVGTPITFGCVMLPNPIASKLFDMAYIGMPVTILQ